MRSAAIFIRDPRTKSEKLLGTVAGEATIGKGDGAHLRINDLRCEPLHALIETDPTTGNVKVTDLGTHFGTYVGGRKIQYREFAPGESFTIGRHQLVVRPGQKTSLPLEPSTPEPEMYREDHSPFVDLQAQPAPKKKAALRPKLLSDTTHLQVSLYWGDELLEQKTFESGQSVTLGTEIDSTFGVTLRDPRLRESPFKIAQYEADRVLLHIPAEATGLIWVDQEAVSLDEIRHKDKSKREFGDLKLKLALGDRADVQIGELSLSFRFVTPAEKLPRVLIPAMDRAFYKVGGIVIGLFILLSTVMLSFEMPVKETTLDDLPKQLKKAVYDAGIAKALKRHRAAIGPLAKNNEGGRASGTEGKSTSVREAQPRTAPMKEKKERVARHKIKPTRSHQSRFAVSQPKNQRAHKPAEKAPEVDIDSAFMDSPKKIKDAPVVGIQGPKHSGNTVAAIIDDGDYAQGRKGHGQGGGGSSVGIGQLSGNQTGGGMGAGDYGLTPAKGKEIRARETEELVISGGLDREVIASVIRRYLAQIQHCYELQLAINPKLKGKVTVGFTIAGNGSVQSDEIVESSLHSKPVESCMLAKIMNWKFPKPKGGGTVGVRYPFLLMSNTGG